MRPPNVALSAKPHSHWQSPYCAIAVEMGDGDEVQIVEAHEHLVKLRRVTVETAALKSRWNMVGRHGR